MPCERGRQTLLLIHRTSTRRYVSELPRLTQRRPYGIPVRAHFSAIPFLRRWLHRYRSFVPERLLDVELELYTFFSAAFSPWQERLTHVLFITTINCENGNASLLAYRQCAVALRGVYCTKVPAFAFRGDRRFMAGFACGHSLFGVVGDAGERHMLRFSSASSFSAARDLTDGRHENDIVICLDHGRLLRRSPPVY